MIVTTCTLPEEWSNSSTCEGAGGCMGSHGSVVRAMAAQTYVPPGFDSQWL